ncbi:DUF721 domain-containing protein, partial [Burkholderia multivorans]
MGGLKRRILAREGARARVSAGSRLRAARA